MAGLIALVQVDIKRVIAYSTMSQIGYMFLAAGLGAYPNAMFHLMTHAFFKALLFMAAGLVIHALAGEQDMRKMGGLNRLLPFTYVCFAIGSLSLAGIPPFAGFFSKDSILAAALDHGWYGELLWVAGHGRHVPDRPLRLPDAVHRLLGRAVGVRAGAPDRADTALRRGPALDDLDRRHAGGADGDRRLPPVRRRLDAGHELARPGRAAARRGERDAGGGLVDPGGRCSALAGIGVAWWIYGARKAAAPRIAWAQNLLEHKFYFDEAYDFAFYRPAVFLATGLDALGRAAARLRLGARARARASAWPGRDTGRLQTGLVRTYVLAIAASVAVLTVVFVAVR